MNRRQFLVLGGLSTATVLAGSTAFRIGQFWWDQTAHPDFAVLSAREVDIAKAIVDALYPGDHLGMPNGNDVGVVAELDDYLGAIHPHKANLLRLLLHAIDDMAIFDDLGLTPFRKRPRAERLHLLNGWDDAGLHARKEAFLGLKIILSMAYCEAPQVLKAAQITYDCGDWR